MMKIHVLQHVPFEGLGSIAAWLAARRAEISYTRFFESCALPDACASDLSIVLGGPMSVNDEQQYPWLVDEKRFIAEAVRADKPVLGICLGAQLIAAALGARVYRNYLKEIGWFPVTATPTPAGAFAFPTSAAVFHWHGETFDLPEGAIQLARSEACEHQAFQVGRNTIGLQFHLETTPPAAEAMITSCREELIEAPFIQSEAELRNAPPAFYEAANRLMTDVLSYLTAIPTATPQPSPRLS